MEVGYHLNEIAKGELGESSKIEEEFLEFKDAIKQESVIMSVIELADMYGVSATTISNIINYKSWKHV